MYRKLAGMVDYRSPYSFASLVFTRFAFIDIKEKIVELQC